MVESLGQILGGTNRDYLQRIYLSTKFGQRLRKVHAEPVKVTVRQRIITLHCRSNAQAAFFRLQRRRLYGELSEIVGKSAPLYTIRVKVSR